MFPTRERCQEIARLVRSGTPADLALASVLLAEQNAAWELIRVLLEDDQAEGLHLYLVRDEE